jgi:iron complex outermembrane receptor protein
MAGGVMISPGAAHAQAALSYDISAGPLAVVLNRFAEASGIKLFYDSSLTTGLTSPGLEGSYGPAEGLSRILTGSGLTFRQTGPSAFTLERAPQSADGAIQLGPVRVEGESGRGTGTGYLAPPQALIGNVPPAYEGGQVARGAQLGLLGNRDFMDAPFNITSYTSQTIRDQQARSILDVLANDPSVRAGLASGSRAEGLVIRGFPVGDGSIAFNGLFGMAPHQRTSIEAVERVEILKGPSAMLSGIVPDGSVGGIVVLVPKRATDDPLTRLSAGYRSNAQAQVHLDIGRRFGDSGEFGVRVNGVYRGGEGPIKDLQSDLFLGAVALDYRSERFRVVIDAYSQNDKFDGGAYAVILSGPVPSHVPDSSKPISLGDDMDAEDRMAMARVEYDVTSGVTAFAAYGYHEYRSLSADTNYFGRIAADGSHTAALAATRNNFNMQSAEVGIRTNFRIGGLQHQLSVVGTMYTQKAFYNAIVGPSVASNIYAPVRPPRPANPGKPPQTIDTKLTSFAIADTISAFDDRVQLTLGLRRQQVDVDSVWVATGAYKRTATSPSVGLVIKPTSNISIYTNYIQGLSQGPVAPLGRGLINEGQVFPPFKSEQYEGGIKGDFNGFGATLSIFQIGRPSAIIQDNRFDVDGEQRNRGVELSLFGEPTTGIRLLGGIALTDAKITKAVGPTQGNDAYGVPKRQVNFGAEWDTSFVPGLTLTARGIYSSSVYINSVNTYSIPGWTRWDAGLRYATELGGKPLTLRANIENVLGDDYWMGHRWELSLGRSTPRTFTLSAAVDL